MFRVYLKKKFFDETLRTCKGKCTHTFFFFFDLVEIPTDTPRPRGRAGGYVGLEPTKTTKVIVLGGRSCVPEGGDLCESMRVIRSLAPPSGAFATPPSTTPAIMASRGLPWGEFFISPPQITPTTRDGSHVRVASGPLLLEWVGTPVPPLRGPRRSSSDLVGP